MNSTTKCLCIILLIAISATGFTQPDNESFYAFNADWLAVSLRRSLEWSADVVIFQLIEKSPVWHPAIQKGQPVHFRQMQNLVMHLQ